MDQMKTTGTWKNQKDGFSLQQEKGLWLVFIVSKYFWPTSTKIKSYYKRIKQRASLALK